MYIPSLTKPSVRPTVIEPKLWERQIQSVDISMSLEGICKLPKGKRLSTRRLLAHIAGVFDSELLSVPELHRSWGPRVGQNPPGWLKSGNFTQSPAGSPILSHALPSPRTAFHNQYSDKKEVEHGEHANFTAHSENTNTLTLGCWQAVNSPIVGRPLPSPRTAFGRGNNVVNGFSPLDRIESGSNQMLLRPLSSVNAPPFKPGINAHRAFNGGM